MARECTEIYRILKEFERTGDKERAMRQLRMLAINKARQFRFEREQARRFV